jgi:hypothetical protein
MAGWEEELAKLLRELGVAQEEPKAHLQSTRKGLHRDANWQDQAVDDIFSEDDDAEDEDAWLDDPTLMRLEVESIVSQVIRLMQRGDLDKSSKEDVMVVLHALRRRALAAQQAATTEEAINLQYLESATTLLHFCRLVLRLSESAIEDL